MTAEVDRARRLDGGRWASHRVLAWLVRKPGGDLITSLFLLTPLMMGAIGSYWWRNMRRLALFWAVLLDSLVAVVLSALIAGEGAICLVILFPLLVFMIWLGARPSAKRSPASNRQPVRLLQLS